MEEVASYWNTQLTWQIFFCAMVSTFTTNTFSTAFQGFTLGSLPFGVYTKTETILFEVEQQLPVNLFMLIPVVFVGVLCGLLACIFTFINLRVTRWRIKRIFPHKTLRIFEVCAIAILASIMALYIPSLFECTTSCKKGVMKSKSIYSISPDDACLLHRRNPRSLSPRLPTFTCEPIVGHEETLGRNSSSFASNSHMHSNGTINYNEMSALLLLPGDEAIEHLFSRATPNEFHPGQLLAFLAIYLPFAAYTAGCSISSGIVVPVLLIGGTVGRLIGQLIFQYVVVETSIPNDWIDPGAFALIGAASFFGGVSRLTVSLAVIMVEITNDGSYLMPIMLGSIIAKWTADYFTHSLYHGLIEIKAYPFLDKSKSQVSDSKLELYRVEEIMVAPVVYLTDVASVADIVDILMTNKHGGYPIVEYGGRRHSNIVSDTIPLYRGTVSRLHLISILEHIQQHGLTTFDNPKKSRRGTIIDIRRKNNGQYVSYRYLEKIHVKYPLHKNGRVLTNFLLAMKNSKCSDHLLDLRPYVNFSAPSVSRDSSVHRALIIFQALGLRHLVVTNKTNAVVGILTRKDLLDFRLAERLETSSEDRVFEPNPLINSTKYRASTNFMPRSNSDARRKQARGTQGKNLYPGSRNQLLPSSKLKLSLGEM